MADRLDYFFRQRVTEAELDLGFELLERADRNLAADLGFVGVVAGAVVSQHAPVPDLTVDVSGPGAIYDQLGERVFFSSLQNVNVAQDDNGVSTAVAAGGNERIVSVFVKFDRSLSDPRVDGNSLTVFFRRDESFRFIVAQGAEAPAGTALPPPLRSDAILLGDVTRTFGQTQILNAVISTARRQDAFVIAGSPRSLRRGRTIEAISDLLALYNAHVGGAADHHAANTVDYAGGGNWADGGTNPATTAEAQLDKIIADLAAATGAPKIGAAATAGAPNALVAGSVKSQVDALLGLLNGHVNQAAGAHAATAIAYAGGGNWKDGTTNPATTVEAQLDKLVSDLVADAGAARIGAQATLSNPTSLAAGSVRSQLDALLAAVNARARIAGETFTGNLLPNATGLDLGSSGAHWDAFLRDVNATASATGIAAVTGSALDTSTPAMRGGSAAFLIAGPAIEASHVDFTSGPITIWDLVKGWTFLPQHTGDIPDATEINGVTQRNIVKAWGSITAAGALNDPHWNVASVSKTGTGLYFITLDVNPGTRNAVVVTVNSGAFNANFSVHVYSPDGVSFEVDINSAGTLSDQAFMFVVLGA